MSTTIRQELQLLREEVRRLRASHTTSLPACCITLPSGNPPPFSPPYGYDLPRRSPGEVVGGDYCRKIQASIEALVNLWNEVMRAKPFWKDVGVSALVYALSTSIMPNAFKNRIVWTVVSEIYNTLLGVIEENLLVGEFSLCEAARQYVQQNSNDIPQELVNAIPLLARPGFVVYWRLSGGITALLDSDEFVYDPSLYNPACCYLDRVSVTWLPKYVGQGCSGYTDNFHGLGWFGTGFFDENDNDVTDLYPMYTYAFNNLKAFRRQDYVGMYFMNPGYPGVLDNRIGVTDSPYTVCDLFSGIIDYEFSMLQQVAYRVAPSGAQYIIIRSRTIDDARHFYLSRNVLPEANSVQDI